MPAPSSTVPPKPATHQLALIGDAKRREFRSLSQWLCSQTASISEFPGIDAALQQDEARLANADLTIVMQSWSDQFSAAEVNQLIGRTLFSRLLCIYSSACESDGRNRNVWPDAVRVPLRLAQSVIEQELQNADRDLDALPPTSARDEIFVHRLGTSDNWAPLPQLQALNGAIISPDRTLRRTMAQATRELGLKSLEMPLIAVKSGQRTRPQETSRGPVNVVIHDLDPWGPLVEASLQAAREMFPSAAVLGLANMPDSGLTIEVADQPLETIIPKLDIQHGLRWCLRQWLDA